MPKMIGMPSRSQGYSGHFKMFLLLGVFVKSSLDLENLKKGEKIHYNVNLQQRKLKGRLVISCATGRDREAMVLSMTTVPAR